MTRTLLQAALEAALEAGKRILAIYGTDFDVEFKEDCSPLTAADRAAHAVIADLLAPCGIALLSEEGAEIDAAERATWSSCWIVDPLDGTKEFVKRNGEFTVNIALVRHGVPVLGVIFAPVPDLLFFGAADLGAYQLRGALREDPRQIADLSTPSLERLPLGSSPPAFTVVGSRSHASAQTDAFVAALRVEHPELTIASSGSSLKLCLIAAAQAHVYPRFSPTMEWDIAAGQAIVEAAGGQVLDAGTGRALTYNKTDLHNPFFVARCAVQRQSE